MRSARPALGSPPWPWTTSASASTSSTTPSSRHSTSGRASWPTSATAKRDANLPTYDPDRERLILDRLAARAGRFPPDAIRAVYREVMSACLALQEPLKIAYMGPEGTFSHAAARSFFGLAATYTETTTIEGVFDAVARREAQHGVVPIENSSEGSVDHALDALVDGDLLIRAELELEVAQCLLTRAKGLASVERVYSHPQALGQCRVWLAKNLAGAQLVQSPSTAAAVREAAADPRAAAVASRLASELYGVPVAARAHPGSRRERHPLRHGVPRGLGHDGQRQDDARLQRPGRTRGRSCACWPSSTRRAST